MNYLILNTFITGNTVFHKDEVHPFEDGEKVAELLAAERITPAPEAEPAPEQEAGDSAADEKAATGEELPSARTAKSKTVS